MIHIITGSTLGGAEYVGDHLSDLLTEQGAETEIYNQASLEEVPAEGIWLIVTSTHGAGDYPDTIAPFMDSLKETPPNMAQVQFAVVAIGDSSYDTFCGAGRDAQATLVDIGATEICPHLEIDILEHDVPEDAAQAWLETHMDKFISA